MARASQNQISIVTQDFFFNAFQFVFLNSVSASYHNAMRSTQRRKRFSQKTSRTNAVVSKRIESVDKDDIELSRQASMLKAVVENDQLRSSRFLSAQRSSGLSAFGILNVNTVRDSCCEFFSLVVEFARLGMVSSADNRCFDAAADSALNDGSRQRRFTGSAHRNVSNADNGNVNAPRRAGNEIVPAISQGDSGSINRFQNRQSCPCRRCGYAARFARNNLSIIHIAYYTVHSQNWKSNLERVLEELLHKFRNAV
jgi:hypothetical protein